MICIVVLWECECVQKWGTKSGPPPTSSVVGIAVLLTDIVWHPNHIWLTDLDYWASGLLSFSQTPDVAGGGRFFSEVPSTIHHWTFGCAQGFQRPSNFVSTNDHKWWEGSPKMWLFWWGRILFQSRVWNVHSVSLYLWHFRKRMVLDLFVGTTCGLNGFQTWKSAGLFTKRVAIECKKSSPTNVPQILVMLGYISVPFPQRMCHICVTFGLSKPFVGIQTNRIILIIFNNIILSGA